MLSGTVPQMPVKARKSYDPKRWRIHLEDVLARAEEAIVQAQMRIERHSRLAAIGGEPWQQRLHLDVHFNLQEGLKLLRLQRAMVHYELYGPRIPRRLVASVDYNKSRRESIGKLREVVAWLDALPKGNLTIVIDGQRQRAMDELARLQIQTEKLQQTD